MTNKTQEQVEREESKNVREILREKSEIGWPRGIDTILRNYNHLWGDPTRPYPISGRGIKGGLLYPKVTDTHNRIRCLNGNYAEERHDSSINIENYDEIPMLQKLLTNGYSKRDIPYETVPVPVPLPKGCYSDRYNRERNGLNRNLTQGQALEVSGKIIKWWKELGGRFPSGEDKKKIREAEELYGEMRDELFHQKLDQVTRLFLLLGGNSEREDDVLRRRGRPARELSYKQWENYKRAKLNPRPTITDKLHSAVYSVGERLGSFAYKIGVIEQDGK